MVCETFLLAAVRIYFINVVNKKVMFTKFGCLSSKRYYNVHTLNFIHSYKLKALPQYLEVHLE